MLKHNKDLWTGKEKVFVDTFENQRIMNNNGAVKWSKSNDDVETNLDVIIQEEEKYGLRETRTTKFHLLNAIHKAIENDNNEFLTYIFHTLPIRDQAIIFNQKNGIHHTIINEKTFIEELAEKGLFLFSYTCVSVFLF